MRIAFVVNDIATEEPVYSTTRLGIAATNRGHEAWVIGVGDLAYDTDEQVKARARRVHKARYKSGQAYLRDLRGASAHQERITIDDFDVVMLRNDPSTEKGKRELVVDGEVEAPLTAYITEGMNTGCWTG